MAALEVLKQEGLLEGHGERRRCRIVAAERGKKAGLRIRVLLYEESDARDEHTLEMQRRLEASGHNIAFAGTEKENGHAR